MNESILADANAKVVYAALNRMSNDRKVIQQAFQHWASGLHGQPFDVIESVASIEKYLGLSTQERKVLMISMHAAANRATHEVPPVPSYVLNSGAEPMAAANSDDVQKVTTKAPVIELTEAYFSLVLKNVLRADAAGYRELSSALEDEGVDGAKADVNKAIRATAVGGLQLPKSIEVAVCQDLCHAFYMLVTEVVGPIEADKASNAAVSSLLDMEAAARFDPRDLL